MQILEKAYDFLLGRMYFTGDNSYQDFLGFAPMLSSLMLDSNKKVTNWISTRISTKKIKPFDTSLEQSMLKFNNSVLVLKSLPSALNRAC